MSLPLRTNATPPLPAPPASPHATKPIPRHPPHPPHARRRAPPSAWSNLVGCPVSTAFFPVLSPPWIRWSSSESAGYGLSILGDQASSNSWLVGELVLKRRRRGCTLRWPYLESAMKSSTSLPPQVDGQRRGEIVLAVEELRWSCSRPASPVFAHVRWWGDVSGQGDRLPLRASGVGSTGGAGSNWASLRWPLRSEPKYVSRFLKDCGSLVITLEEGNGAQSFASLGTVTVGLLALEPRAPVSGTFPILAAPAASAGAAASPSYGSESNASIIGSISVSMQLHYDQAAVSSFELEEHLAPVPPAAAAAAAAAAAEGAATGPETGAAPAAPAATAPAAADRRADGDGTEGPATGLLPPADVCVELEAAAAG